MTLHTYMLFIGASLVLCLVPGPDMLFLLGRTIAQGRAAGLCAALGINLGAYVHLLAAVTGLSALILASATAFSIVKWLGALYLIYLGWGALRAKGGVDPGAADARKNALHRIFWQGFLSDVLNPKVALFYIALLPQFMSAHDPHPVKHLITLGVTGNMVGIATSVMYVLLAARMTAALRRNRSISAWLNKTMGVLFVGLGLKLASEKT
ncbi:LysE family translocator [Cupriavidus sp.]|uniref:LysE family translocator n=1 Tax=Cupriavidus sp. TaxID=1873897 RepID=UPI0025BF1BAB|nr:LysE family translocator [Cupriavidus sp.]MCA3186256.1 LysE family translocator [Cupriavidus sp.]MCA3191205.1 LysE family translocator [Cupriavidus sp.]MCA3200269.1 LysE family translocator [Cupriavidus sp.]MCA3205470.1 LysE family translocator [Cupriavidus sp.]MCA3206674.1 LysE family translocator [Cupriavidus sp.]